MKKIKLAPVVGIVLTIAFLVGLCFMAQTAHLDAKVGSTYYDYSWWTLYTIRNKITTSYSSSSTSYGTSSLVSKFTNNTTISQSYSYSYAKTLEGSVSLGAKIPVKAIELEVGGTVTYSTTTTVSANVTVPAKRTYSVYKRTVSLATKYKNIVQNQWLYTDGTWKNNGSASTEYSTVTKKAPEIIVQ